MTVKRIISSVFVIGMLLAPLSTYTSYAIDFNQSGSVTVADYTAILQYLANGGS